MSGPASCSGGRVLGTTLIVIGMSAVCPALADEPPSFLGIGCLPGGEYDLSYALAVSPDGSAVVGWSTSEQGQSEEAFLWMEDTGMIGLGDLPGGSFRSAATGVSRGGEVVMGWGSTETSEGGSVRRAFRWTRAAGMVNLGPDEPEERDSYAWDVSADGSIVLGEAWWPFSGPNTWACRWIDPTGFQWLTREPGTSYPEYPTAISSDGCVVVGRGLAYDGYNYAFRWTPGTGTIGLGSVTGSSSIAYAVSPDGSAVAGQSPSGSGWPAFRWTEQTGMVSLGDLPGGEHWGEAHGVSADGSVIVGWSDTDSGHRAFIWDAENGMRDLNSVLEESFCLDLTGWTLSEATDISDDGRAIVGSGVNPNDESEGWVAYLGAPRLGDLTGDGDVDSADLSVLLAHYGTPSCAETGQGDLDDDGDVDIADLGALLAAYGTPCE